MLQLDARVRLSLAPPSGAQGSASPPVIGEALVGTLDGTLTLADGVQPYVGLGWRSSHESGLGSPLHSIREKAMPIKTFPSQRNEEGPRLQGPAIGADRSEGLGKVWSRTTCPEGLPPELHQLGKLQRHGVVCGSNMIMPFPTRDGRASRWWSVSSRVRSS